MTTRDTQSNEEWLPIGEAARLLGVSVETVRRWERQGRITPARRTLGGQRRFLRDDIAKIKAVA